MGLSRHLVQSPWMQIPCRCTYGTSRSGGVRRLQKPRNRVQAKPTRLRGCRRQLWEAENPQRKNRRLRSSPQLLSSGAPTRARVGEIALTNPRQTTASSRTEYRRQGTRSRSWGLIIMRATWRNLPTIIGGRNPLETRVTKPDAKDGRTIPLNPQEGRDWCYTLLTAEERRAGRMGGTVVAVVGAELAHVKEPIRRRHPAVLLADRCTPAHVPRTVSPSRLLVGVCGSQVGGRCVGRSVVAAARKKGKCRSRTKKA